MARRSIQVRGIHDLRIDDIEHVLQRAEQAGVEAQVITAGSLAEVPDVLSLTERKPYLFATAGCHPTRSSEMEAYEGGAAAYVAQLHHYIQTQPKIVAVGELGLGMLRHDSH